MHRFSLNSLLINMNISINCRSFMFSSEFYHGDKFWFKFIAFAFHSLLFPNHHNNVGAPKPLMDLDFEAL